MMMDDRLEGVGRIHMRGLEEETWSSWDIVELITRLAITAVFVWAVVVLVSQLVKYLSSRSNYDALSPQEIAKMRYAKGDITKAQYDELKKELK